MATNQIVSLFFSTLCILALTYHVGKISTRYFKYETLTHLEMKRPSQVAPPAFSLCIRYTEFLLDHKLKSIIWTQFKEESYYRNVTVRQIFDHTPPGDQLFLSCMVRYPGSYIIRSYSTNQCLKFFNILKYYVQEYICYQFSPSMKGTIDFNRIASSFNYARLAYKIDLQLKVFNRTSNFCGIVHTMDSLPFVSIQFSAEFRRERHLVYRSYRFSGVQVNHHLLPSPYASHCIPRHNGRDEFVCYKDCLVSMTIAKWRMFPFTEIITDDELVYNLDIPHLTTFELLNNETLAKEYDSIETQCEYRCRFPNCHNSVTVTQMFERSLRDDALVFRIDLPRTFTYSITSLPSMEIVDYVTYVLSCFGTWLGLSAMNFNPVQIWRQLKNLTQGSHQVRSSQLLIAVKPKELLLRNGLVRRLDVDHLYLVSIDRNSVKLKHL